MTNDGLGQSVAEDLRWIVRFQKIRRLAVPWRAPSRDEALLIREHPTIGRFGDDLVALADWQGRRWIVLERLWHGWPDPPRYVLFVLGGDTISLARDFNHWPSAWRKPWRDEAERVERSEREERQRVDRRRAWRDALRLTAGAPLAFAGWWVGTRIASGDWRAPEHPNVAEAEVLAWLGTIFALAVANRLVGRPVRSRWRRSAARLRYKARRRWGGDRPRNEFSRAYRLAVGAGALAAAALLSGLLAAGGVDTLVQSVVLVAALATLLFARVALKVFAFFEFSLGACLLTAFGAAGAAGGFGLP